MIRLGIDTGGSAIKAAPVDLIAGRLAVPPAHVPTPLPATPGAIAAAVRDIVARFRDVSGPIGFAFPAVVKNGIACTAANVDPSWIGTDGARLVGQLTGRPVAFINDADAAGLAEMRFGAGQGAQGLVIVLTFGTGIGSAIFENGVLVPNTEFGRMEVGGREAEQCASARARTEQQLDWQQWAGRVNEFLERMRILFWPDLFILGGGVSENWAQYGRLLESATPIVPARLGNSAGIVGAALAAARL